MVPKHGLEPKHDTTADLTKHEKSEPITSLIIPSLEV